MFTSASVKDIKESQAKFAWMEHGVKENPAELIMGSKAQSLFGKLNFFDVNKK